MSFDEKRKALDGASHFHEARAAEITFASGRTRVIIFPSNWSELMKNEEYTYTDKKTKSEEIGSKTIYYVFSPDSVNPQILKKMAATPALHNKIKLCLNDGLKQGWDGPVIAEITMTKSETYTSWSVKGQKFEEDLPDTSSWKK